MGDYVGNGDLCLCEFSKSLNDRAYTLYTTLPPGSVKSWEDMVELFCGKYSQVEEKITLVNLHSTKQASGEDLLHYIHHFRDISLDCYVNYEESELVGVCIDNMLPKFRAHLENLDISRFAQLLQKARKTALSVKPHTEKPREKKNQPQVLTVSTANNKRKKSTKKTFEEPPPPVPYNTEEMITILDKWVADGIVKLSEAKKKKQLTWTRRTRSSAAFISMSITLQQIAGPIVGNSMRRSEVEPWISLKHSKRYILTPFSNIKTKLWFRLLFMEMLAMWIWMNTLP